MPQDDGNYARDRWREHTAAYDINLTAGLTDPGHIPSFSSHMYLTKTGNLVDQNGDGQTNSADRFTANFSISLPGVVGPDAFGYDAFSGAIRQKELVGQPGATALTFGSTDDGFATLNLARTHSISTERRIRETIRSFASTNGLIAFGSSTILSLYRTMTCRV